MEENEGFVFFGLFGFRRCTCPLDSLCPSDRAAGPTLRHTLHHTHAHALTPFHIDTCLHHARTHSHLILPHFPCIMDGFLRKKCSHFLVSIPHFIARFPSSEKKSRKVSSLCPTYYIIPTPPRSSWLLLPQLHRALLIFSLRVCERCLVAVYQFFELFPSLHFPFLRGMDVSAWCESPSAIAVGGVLKHVGTYNRA